MSFQFTMTDLVNNNNINTNNIIYTKIGEDFCKVYYQKISEGGFSNVMNYFWKDSKCTFDNQEFNGPYGVLVKLSQMGVHKFSYKKISGNFQPIGDSILICSSGDLCPLSFQKTSGKLIKFSETFILTNINGIYCITNYVFRFLK